MCAILTRIIVAHPQNLKPQNIYVIQANTPTVKCFDCKNIPLYGTLKCEGLHTFWLPAKLLAVQCGDIIVDNQANADFVDALLGVHVD